MDGIYSWVKSIVFFLVLTTILDNLVESTSYKKYINLISGMILIILVISPLFDLFDINEKIDYNFEKNSFASDTQNINNDLIKMEEAQLSAILEEYKKEIEDKTRGLLEKENLFISYFQIEINEDGESDLFGEIEKMEIVASYTVENESLVTESIEKVEIDKIEIGTETKTETDGVNGENSKINDNNLNEDIDLSDNEIYMKNLLSDFYNIDSDNINISIQEY